MAHIPLHYLAVLILGSTFLTGCIIAVVSIAIYKRFKWVLDPIIDSLLDNYFDNE